jgi:glycerol-3-phosphate dehydrogenase
MAQAADKTASAIEPVYDLAIIGGGINGCGIARDAAGRGLCVYLCEQGDFGGGTSSASTKLIHGGLRYLETFQFRLVREALAEREVLLHAAPHLVRPQRFVLPHHPGLRPRWMLRAGLFLYDWLGSARTFAAARSLNLRDDVAGRPLKPEYRYGFEYSDCTVDDARLVIVNAVDARTRGASMNPHTRCVSAERTQSHWILTMEQSDATEMSTIHARVLVNAAGPWVGTVLKDVLGSRADIKLRLDKGSHIIVPRLFEHERAYIFQNPDGRVLFAIPYERDFTLLGTTDQEFDGDPDTARIDASEIEYLCDTASAYFRTPVRRGSVVWSYSGVRALYGERGSKAQDASRDYVLKLDAPRGAAPLLTIYGGKLTTYRRLAEAALQQLSQYLATGRPWTAAASLPGGDLPNGGMAALLDSIRGAYPFLEAAHAERLARSYGTRAHVVLGKAQCAEDLGEKFAAGLTESEVRYLIGHEWASTASDILWRRSKLGLRFTPGEIERLQNWMTNTPIAASPFAR